MAVSAIVISGSMGSGKTTVLGEASDLLCAAGVAHATIDLDALGTGAVPDGVAEDLVYRHLAAIYANIVNAGITRVLLAQAIERRADLDRIRRALPGAGLVICRLTASIPSMEARVRTREPGMLQRQFVARVRELDRVLAQAALDDFAIVNDGRSVTDVARELLQRARWTIADDGT